MMGNAIHGKIALRNHNKTGKRAITKAVMDIVRVIDSGGLIAHFSIVRSVVSHRLFKCVGCAPDTLKNQHINLVLVPSNGGAHGGQAATGS